MSAGPAHHRIEPRWWGWGDPAVSTELPEKARKLLAERGMEPVEGKPLPAIGEVRIPPARELPVPVAEAAGDGLRTDVEARLRHSGGHSLRDLLARRSGVLDYAPDAVVTPSDEGSIKALLSACAESRVAVVPWGGGTSVTGGLSVSESNFVAVIALDMSDFRRFDLDPVSMTATLGAGLRGPEVESLLGREGFTLGHYPQSFEFATVGGFAAARSAGQSSGGYGRFDEMVTALHLISPAGEIVTTESPRTSSGPSLKELVLGSEGALGVITDVTVRIRHAPAVTEYEGWLARDFGAGVEAVRRLSQDGRLPTVIRVSDETETGISIGMSRPDGIAGRLFDGWLRIRGRSNGVLVITGYEGTPSSVREMRAATRRELDRAGAISLGRKAGRGWSEARFHGPYLRESLLDLGFVVETFETATIWTNYMDAYREIEAKTVEGLRGAGMEGIVMCHLSHSYPESASLYFTVIATPGAGGPLASWAQVKDVAMQTLDDLGLTVSHHHGVGRDHAEWLEGQIGETGIAVIGSLKDELDPTGIMNPGCLLR